MEKLKLKKYNLSGVSVGEVEVAEQLISAWADGQMVKDYIIALRENKRQWSANTKGRSEVNHTTRKAQKQKGTGNARHGMLCVSQYRGGGVVFGPKPKFNQHVRINKKERRAAVRFLMAEKIRNGKVCLIENFEMDQPKTKKIVAFLEKCELGRKVLFVSEGSFEEFSVGGSACQFSVHSDHCENFVKSMRNLPRVRFSLTANINGYDLLNADNLVFSEKALNEITNRLCQ